MVVKDTYKAIHNFLSRHGEGKQECDHCGAKEDIEWSLIHGRKYSRNTKDYLRLCVHCHRKYDHLLHKRKSKNLGFVSKIVRYSSGENLKTIKVTDQAHRRAKIKSVEIEKDIWELVSDLIIKHL